MRCKACNTYMEEVKYNKHGLEDLCRWCRQVVKHSDYLSVKEYQWESLTDEFTKYKQHHPDE